MRNWNEIGFTITADGRAAETLRRVAQERGLSVIEVLRRACDLYLHAHEYENKGYYLGFVRDPEVLDKRIVNL